MKTTRTDNTLPFYSCFLFFVPEISLLHCLYYPAIPDDTNVCDGNPRNATFDDVPVPIIMHTSLLSGTLKILADVGRHYRLLNELRSSLQSGPRSILHHNMKEVASLLLPNDGIGLLNDYCPVRLETSSFQTAALKGFAASRLGSMDNHALQGFLCSSFPLYPVPDLLETEFDGDDDVEEEVPRYVHGHSVPGEAHITSSSSPPCATISVSPVQDFRSQGSWNLCSNSTAWLWWHTLLPGIHVWAW